MAPSKSFRTYSRGNTSVSAVDAFNILFANNLTQRKLHGKKLKGKKLEIKELPRKIKTILTDDSLSLRVNINDTFDNILKPEKKTLAPSSSNGSAAENKSSFLVPRKDENSHPIGQFNFSSIQNVSPMVKRLRSFKNNSSNSMQKASWFDQSTAPGEAITNSLEVEVLGSSPMSKRTRNKNVSKSNSSRSSPVLLRSRIKDTSLPNASKDISNKNSTTADKDSFKNPKDLLPPNMSISAIAENNSLLNPLFHNCVRENGLVHSSTPLISKGGPRILVQPISPINTQSNNQDELKSYILESLDDIRSWNSSLPAVDNCEKIKVAQEKSPQKRMSYDLNEFEAIFEQLSAISRKQENGQSITRSFPLEYFETFCKAMLESEKTSTNTNPKNISLSDFESFCESYVKTVSIDKESFFDSCHRSGFVTHRKHKIIRNSHKKHFTLKDLVVVLDKNIFNVSKSNFIKHRSLPKNPTLKQLTVNVTQLSLRSNRTNSKPIFKAKDKVKGKKYQACKKFSLNWDRSHNSPLMSKNSSNTSRSHYSNASTNQIKSDTITTGRKNKKASKPKIIRTSLETNQVNARKKSESKMPTESRSDISINPEKSSERISISSSLEKQYISQILINSILEESHTNSQTISPLNFINRRRPSGCRKIYDIDLDKSQHFGKDMSEKNYIAQDYSNIIFKSPEKEITDEVAKDAGLSLHNLSVSPDLFDSYDCDNKIERPRTRSQNASHSKTEYNSYNLKYISNASKMQTSQALILSKSGNTATQLSAESKIIYMSGKPPIEGYVPDAQGQVARNELLDNLQNNQLSLLSAKSSDSQKLCVADSKCSGNGRVSNDISSLQDNLLNFTPERTNYQQLAKGRNYSRKIVGLTSVNNRITDSSNLSVSHRVTRSSLVSTSENLKCLSNIERTTDSCNLSDSHRFMRSLSVPTPKNIKCHSSIDLTNKMNSSLCSLNMSLPKNSACGCCFENDSHRVTRSMSDSDFSRSSNLITSQSHNYDKELIILVDSFKGRVSHRYSVNELQTLSSSTNTPQKYVKTRAREINCHSTDKEFIIVLDTPDVMPSCSSSLKKSSIIKDQISSNCTRPSRRSPRCRQTLSFQPKASCAESSTSTLENFSSASAHNVTLSKTNQNGNISDISTLPENLQSDKNIELELTDVVFKIPSFPGFNPTPGKHWRRSLMRQKKSIRESFVGANKSTINRPDISTGYSSPLTYSENNRMSIKILPAHDLKRIRRRTALQSYVYSEVISEDGTNKISLPKKLSLPVITAKDMVLKYCQQEEPILFEKAYPTWLLKNCKKIGEGVYGEVFLCSQPDGSTTVMKVIPIEGNQIINGERQKKFHEILSEVAIVSELSNLKINMNNSTPCFCEVQRIKCVKGKYPSILLDRWEEYDNNKGSENDPPDIFKEDQLYVVLDLGNGGEDLEAFHFNNASQAVSMFKQISYTLAIAEEELQFEHRDLHWGNVLLRRVDKNKKISFKHKGKVKNCQTEGIEVTVIDFTLSRMTHDDVVIFNDLGQDPELFQAEGDYQFEIYRLMKERNCNDWQKFTPYTNVLWLHYILNKSITAVRYKNTKTKSHKQGITIFKKFEERLLECKSATEFVKECL